VKENYNQPKETVIVQPVKT